MSHHPEAGVPSMYAEKKSRLLKLLTEQLDELVTADPVNNEFEHRLRRGNAIHLT
jgi:hypothetical protein